MNIKVTKKLVLQNFPMLDDHNAESVVAALTSDVKFNGRLGGQTFKPTGTGKTLIQAAIIALDIMLNPKKNGIYILHVPRIILSYQQLKALYKFNQKYSNWPLTLRFWWGNVDYESHQTIHPSHVFSSRQN